MSKIKEITYGGQAVLEGVMMAGPQGKAITCRQPDGKLIYKVEKKQGIRQKYPLLNLPIIRGFISFCSSLISGMSDISWSALHSGAEEEGEDTMGVKEMVIAIILAALLSIGIFVVFPVYAANWVTQYIGPFGRSLTEGLLRIGVFVAYILLVRRMSDMRRLFACHGAEHKTINAYEAGAALTPQVIKNYSRIHTRCGTSFVLMSMLLMIVVFTFVGQTDPLHRILIKLLCMPLVAGLGFELFRLPIYFPKSKLCHALVSPGLALQRLTTEEPDEKMIEIAVHSLISVPGWEPKNEIQKESIAKEFALTQEELAQNGYGNDIIFGNGANDDKKEANVIEENPVLPENELPKDNEPAEAKEKDFKANAQNEDNKQKG